MAAGGAGVIIPQSIDFNTLNIKKQEEIINKFSDLKNALNENDKKLIEEQIKTRKQEKDFQKSQTQLNNIIYPRPIEKIKKKLYLEYDKWIIKGKFFKSLKGIFKAIAKMATGAGGWLMDFLEFLFILALLGPKFAASLLNMIVNLIIMLANIIIPMIPGVIKTFMDLIFKIVPPLFKKLVQTIFPMIGKALDEIFKGTMLYGFGQKLFGKDGILTKFFSGIADKIPYLLMFMLGLKALMVIMALNPIGLAVAALTALYLLFTNDTIKEVTQNWLDDWDKFGENFKKDWDRTFGDILPSIDSISSSFNNLSSSVINGFTEATNFISKGWQSLNDIWSDINNTWIKDLYSLGEDIAMFFTVVIPGFFTSLPGYLTKLGKKYILKPIFKFFINLGKGILNYLEPILNPGKFIKEKAASTWQNVKQTGKDILMSIVQSEFAKTIGKAFKWLEEQFFTLGDLIAAVKEHVYSPTKILSHADASKLLRLVNKANMASQLEKAGVILNEGEKTAIATETGDRLADVIEKILLRKDVNRTEVVRRVESVYFGGESQNATNALRNAMKIEIK